MPDRKPPLYDEVREAIEETAKGRATTAPKTHRERAWEAASRCFDSRHPESGVRGRYSAIIAREMYPDELVQLLREAAGEMESAADDTAGTTLEQHFRGLAEKYRTALALYEDKP